MRRWFIALSLLLAFARPASAQVQVTGLAGVAGAQPQTSLTLDVGDHYVAEPWAQAVRGSDVGFGVDAILFGPHYMGLIAGVDSGHGYRVGFIGQFKGLQVRVMRHLNAPSIQTLVQYDWAIGQNGTFRVAVLPATDRSELVSGFTYTWRHQ